jgi:LCP family protein required for cell wall assembly
MTGSNGDTPNGGGPGKRPNRPTGFGAHGDSDGSSSPDGNHRNGVARGKSWWRRLTRRGRVVVAGGTVISLISGCAGGLYLKLAGNLNVETIQVVGERPLASPAGENILLLGSQTRDGQIGKTFGGQSKLGSDISDTALLVHLSSDRLHAVVTSIPRDLIVPRPECASRADPHTTIPGSSADMFDHAMNLGGPSCAVATVEHMTHMRVDHFVRLDFNGFRAMVNALGGVEVCVPTPGIHDWRSGLDLPAGRHVIRDQEALAFVRDRHGVGDGGDLGRIRMQQVFLASLAQRVQSAGTLSNPVTLYRLADAATSALTVDPGLGSIPKLLALAKEIRGLTTHNITFLTAPAAPDYVERNRLIPTQPQFDGLFQAISADTPVNLAALSSPVAVDPDAGRHAAATASTAASSVSVRVINATGEIGVAGRVGRELRAAGFRVVGISRGLSTPTTTMTTGSGDDALAAALLGSIPVVGPGRSPGEITLTLGKDFAGVRQAGARATHGVFPAPSDTGPTKGVDPATATDRGAPVANPTPTAADASSIAPPVVSTRSNGTRTADSDICAGLPRPRSDAGVRPDKPHSGQIPAAPAAPPTPTPPPAPAPARSLVATRPQTATPADLQQAEPPVRVAPHPSAAPTHPVVEQAPASAAEPGVSDAEQPETPRK